MTEYHTPEALEAARQEARRRLAEYLRLSHGIEVRAGKPIRCINPQHEDKHPSMFITPDGKHVKCFSCGAAYDVFDIARLEMPSATSGEVFNHVYQTLGIFPLTGSTPPRERPVEAGKEEKPITYTLEQIEARSRAREAARREYDAARPAQTHPYLQAKRLSRFVGPARQAGDRLLIPRVTVSGGEFIGYEWIGITLDARGKYTRGQASGTEPKAAPASAYMIRAPEPPIGEPEGDALGEARPLWTPSRRVIVAEGAATAETIAQALTAPGGLPLYRIIAASFGTNNLARVADALAETNPDAELYIAADVDTAGLQAARAARLAGKGKVRALLIPPKGLIPPDGKDWNDCYIAAYERYGSEADALAEVREEINKKIGRLYK